MCLALLMLMASFYGAACSRKLETRYDSGQLNEKYEVKKDAAGNYVKHGSYGSWYENGKQKQEGTFKDDKKDGKHIFWYENGSKESEGIFQNDKKTGSWDSWYDKGQKK